MTDAVLLDAARTAALVAPVVDRLRMAVSRRAAVLGGPTFAAAGLSPRLGDGLAMLRNLDDRPLPPPGLRTVLAYAPPEEIDGLQQSLVEGGYLAPGAEGLHLTPAAGDAVEAVHRFSQEAAEELWPEDVARLDELVGRALDAARADGGPAFQVMAPAAPRAGASTRGVLGERLTGLRFHRYDAHIAAWQAVGLTAAQIAGLGAGPDREAIEVDTNRRAATPYEALTADERLELLAGLAALPG